MARPGRLEGNRAARSFRQLSDFTTSSTRIRFSVRQGAAERVREEFGALPRPVRCGRSLKTDARQRLQRIRRTGSSKRKFTKVIDYYRGRNPELTILLILFLLRS